MITSNNDTLAIVAEVFSLYNVTDESFNMRSDERFRLDDWNFLTDVLLKRLSPNYPNLNPAYTDFVYSQVFTIPVGGLSVKEARSKIDEAIEIYKREQLEASFNGMYVEVNPNYKNVWFNNIIKIEISSCIPTIVIECIDRNTVHFNYEDYGAVYKFIVENRRELSKLYPEIAMTIKYYINFLYGALSSEKSMIRSTFKNGEVVSKYNRIANKIYEDFKYYVIYIDADDIYIRDYPNVVDDIIGVMNSDGGKITHSTIKYNFNYHVETGYSGMVLAKKKCVLIKDGELKLKGIKSLD